MITYSDKKFDPQYTLGQVIYHRANGERQKGVIITLKLYADGGMAYEVNWADKTTGTNFEVELTDVFLKDYTDE